MDDRSLDNRPQSSKKPPADPSAGPAVLVVCPPSHPVCDPLTDKLGKLGCSITRINDVYAATVLLACNHDRFVAVMVAVDFLNRDEFRFLPMAKRRWPHGLLVAVSRPAFAYKAAVADLAGADMVITDADADEVLLERLGLGSGKARCLDAADEPTPPAATSPAVPPKACAAAWPADVPHAVSPEPESPVAATSHDAAPVQPTASAARPAAAPPGLDSDSSVVPPRRKPPATASKPLADAPPQSDRPQTARDILTEEEIAALMDDLDDLNDQPPQRLNGTEHD
jgi:hypothetical protein